METIHQPPPASSEAEDAIGDLARALHLTIAAGLATIIHIRTPWGLVADNVAIVVVPTLGQRIVAALSTLPHDAVLAGVAHGVQRLINLQRDVVLRMPARGHGESFGIIIVQLVPYQRHRRLYQPAVL